jgi:hypothetical protein
MNPSVTPLSANVSNTEPTAHIGISGWRYPPWRGDFYPPELAQRRELEYASRRLDSIEINGTFYGLQRPSSFLHWREEAPDNFVFAVKGSKHITHELRLKNTEEAVADFFASVGEHDDRSPNPACTRSTPRQLSRPSVHRNPPPPRCSRGRCRYRRAVAQNPRGNLRKYCLSALTR